MNKYNLLWLSDSPNFITGYANVTKNILNRLQNDHNWNCTALANMPIGEPIKRIELQNGNHLNFNIVGAHREPYCMDVLPKYIKKYKIDCMGILLDTFMIYPRFLQVDIPCKSFFYFPSDGTPHLPLRCEQILEKVSLPIAMSKFAQRQAKETHGIKAEYIPHGVSPEIYRPLLEKNNIKNKVPCYMFNGQGLIEVPGVLNDKFVVGSVYRNQPRKQPDRLYKSFAKFAKDKPDAVLYLHTDPFDSASPFDTINLLMRLNILHKVVFSGMDFVSGLSTEELNEIYNAMDIFFLSTTGEGFGIPTLEAMSAGIPVVITDSTTTPELIMENGQAGEPVKLLGTEPISVHELMYERGYNHSQVQDFLSNGLIVGSWNVDRAIMDLDHAVEKLNKLYYDPKLREKYGRNGRIKAVKYYDWQILLPVWDKVLRGLIES